MGLKRDFSNYEVLEIEELIRNYINYPESGTGIRLSNRDIKGADLVAVLDNLGFETDKEMEEYKKIKGDYENLYKDYDKIKENFQKLKESYENLIEAIELIIKETPKGKLELLIEKIKNEKKELEI